MSDQFDKFAVPLEAVSPKFMEDEIILSMLGSEFMGFDGDATILGATDGSASQGPLGASIAEGRQKELHRARQKRHYHKKKAGMADLTALHKKTEDELAAQRRNNEAKLAYGTILEGLKNVTEEMATALSACAVDGANKNKNNNHISSPSSGLREESVSSLHSPETNLKIDSLPLRKDEANTRLVPLGNLAELPTIDELATAAALQLSPTLLDAVSVGPPDELIMHWRQFALEVRSTLHELDSRPVNDGIMQKLNDQMNTMGLALTVAMQRNQAAMLALWSAGVPPKPHASDSLAEMENWEENCRYIYRQVVAAMKPTAGQKRRVAQAWNRYQATCGDSATQGAAHILQIHKLVLERPSYQEGAECLPSLGAQLESREQLDAYNKVMQRQHLALLDLMQESGDIFDLVQKARATAQAAPYFPDILQVMRVLAEDGV